MRPDGPMWDRRRRRVFVAECRHCRESIVRRARYIWCTIDLPASGDDDLPAGLIPDKDDVELRTCPSRRDGSDSHEPVDGSIEDRFVVETLESWMRECPNCGKESDELLPTCDECGEPLADAY